MTSTTDTTDARLDEPRPINRSPIQGPVKTERVDGDDDVEPKMAGPKSNCPNR